MKALIFDVDDTLYDQVQPFQRAIANFLPLNDEEEIVALYKTFRKRADEVFVASARGEMSMKDMHIYRMKKALEDRGYFVTDQMAYEIQEAYQKEQGQLELMAGAESLFAYCQKNGIQLGLITNGPHLHQLRKIQALDLHQWIPENRTIISGQVGVMKPSTEIFRMMETQLALPPEEICYVGDSFENDIVGAKGAGWKAIWLNHRKRQCSDYSVTPDATITKLEEVQDWLRKTRK
ncbi:HAD family hydrolase [Streptococcus ovis]|uniref:HAD family hydrolase n=1 Tax=Streptococcus ovis TaxID=82806 RepID=UPI000382B2F7|nr:HAD family hydrolase [Streptococcus ovis]